MASSLLSVNKIYQTFWAAFALHCKSLGDIKGNPRATRDADGATLDCLIFLKGWPYKSVTGRRTRQLDIVVRAVEKFSKRSWRVQKSDVHVLYLQPSLEGEAKVIQNIHYDFQENPDSAHPVFHAQFGNKMIEDFDKFPEISLPSNFRLDPTDDKAYKNLRIPTAHMGLASVLFSLAADHLEHDVFEVFAQSTSKCLESIPDAECDSLRANAKSDSFTYKSMHWYY